MLGNQVIMKVEIRLEKRILNNEHKKTIQQ